MRQPCQQGNVKADHRGKPECRRSGVLACSILVVKHGGGHVISLIGGIGWPEMLMPARLFKAQSNYR